MKPSLHFLASTLFLPSTLALTLPRSPLTPRTVTPPIVNSTTNATITPPTRYYLQTRVKGDADDDKNGLYVSAYHTGAGENDATLGPVDVAAVGYLNGTNQQFNLSTAFPWGMVMVLYDYYAEWDFAAINAGYGDAGFYFNETGLQYGSDEGFAGWLACDWWQGVPQLFWKYFTVDTVGLPGSCAAVDLVPVAISEG